VDDLLLGNQSGYNDAALLVGGLRREVSLPVSGQYFGYAISGAGDINGDGREEFLVSAPALLMNNKQGAGRVLIFSYPLAAACGMGTGAALLDSATAWGFGAWIAGRH
jgi:hypothetical protein